MVLALSVDARVQQTLEGQENPDLDVLVTFTLKLKESLQ